MTIFDEIQPLPTPGYARRLREAIDRGQAQIRAAFDASALVIRGTRSGLGVAETIIREVARVEREIRALDRSGLIDTSREAADAAAYILRQARRQRDELDAATYYGGGRPSDFSNAAFGVDGAEADRMIGFDPGGQDQTAWVTVDLEAARDAAGVEAVAHPSTIATVHLEDDGLLERDERTMSIQCQRCGRIWTDIEIVQAPRLDTIGIGRRRMQVASSQARRARQRRAVLSTNQNRAALDVIFAAARGWGKSSRGRPAEKAPDHATKLAEPSPKLPLYRPT